ncbi:MAG: histidine kinase dimerization/phosphoacceptor domain-containing protein [Chitinophagaceae bacterium]|nr:histidine kinase dimerization/phosphoacceptor domain-containing protein [Chitinophagaceae bacterium]
MSVKKLCCFFLIIFSIPAFSQEEEIDPDNAIKKYLRIKKNDVKTNLAFALGEFYWATRNLPEAKKWFKNCLDHTPAPTDSNNVVNTLHLLANVYLNEAVYDSALFYCNASFTAIGRISNKTYLPNLYQTKGRIYLPLGDLQSAVNFFTIADSLYQISRYEIMRAQSPYVKISLGQIFQNHNQMGRAKEYFDLALQISRQHNSINTIATSLQTLAGWQIEMKQYAAAKENYLLLMRPPYFKATSYRLIYTYTGMGDVYLGLKNYDSALYYYKLSMYEAQVKGEVYQQDLFYRKLGDSYLKLRNIPLAKVYYDSSIWWGKKNNKSASAILSYQALSEIATSENDFKTAYRYMQLKERVKDSVLTIKNLELSNNLYTLNNLKQKDVAINLLTATNVANDKKIRKGKTLTNLLFGFVGVMGFVFLFFTNRMQLKRKLDKQLAITGERERIIADLHDDVGATLSSIHIYSELAGSIIETKKAESKDLMNKIS